MFRSLNSHSFSLCKTVLEVSVETPSPLELQQSLLNVFYLLAPEFAGMDLFLRIIWLVRARRTAIMPTISVIMPG